MFVQLSDNLFLRNALFKDYDSIHYLAKTGGLYCYPKIVYLVLALLGKLYVLIEHNKIIGYMCYVSSPILGVAFLAQICIDNNHQGKGVGKKLLQFFTNDMKNYRISTLLTHTLKPEVVLFFEKYGWSVILEINQIFFLKKNIN